MTTSPCPRCGQNLRWPDDIGELTVTCPRCRYAWNWSPPTSAYGNFTVFLVVLCSLKHSLDETCERFPMVPAQQIRQLYRHAVTTRQAMMEAMMRTRYTRWFILPIRRKALREDTSPWQANAIRYLEDG